ncbi:MAG TPA: ABC transporter permease [Casimicrobiaceae bacterium]|nr:ABC transporter permease [Casimicrobiaceae bacterium]
MSPVRRDAAPLGYYRDLVITLTIKEIKVRYKRTFLGYAWSLLNPIVYAVTYWIAFKAILNVRIEGYFVFLLCGLFPWQWLSSSLMSSPGGFVTNASLIKKISFPRYLIVLSTIITEGLHYLLCIPVLTVIMLAMGRGGPHWSWLIGIPALLVLQATISFGIALAIASCNVFFRDIERLLSLVMTVLFYLTPVIYEPKMVPEYLRPIMAANPFAPLIVAWRRLFIDGQVDWTTLGTAAIAAAVSIVVGAFAFHQTQWKFAEAL